MSRASLPNRTMRTMFLFYICHGRCHTAISNLGTRSTTPKMAAVYTAYSEPTMHCILLVYKINGGGLGRDSCIILLGIGQEGRMMGGAKCPPLPLAKSLFIITRRMQCIVGSPYAVYTAAIFGVVQNYAR